jgi:predicted O-methyltransferase YrrM
VTQRQQNAVDRRIAQLPPRLQWAAGALRLTLREPADGFDRVLGRARELVRRHEPTGHAYAVDVDWYQRLHERLGSAWPCAQTAEFHRLWNEVVDEVRVQGVSLGRGTYGGWDDGDPGLARAIWCLIHALRPAKVVETGVAHGVTSRIILEALERAGNGHLWSIDLPAMDSTIHHEIGIAVPDRLRARWTYITGTSRRRLPGLLSQIGPIDLFVHDSSHTERNMSFELQQAWPAIRRGAIVADDVHQSPAFAKFTASVLTAGSYVATADDASALFGVVLKEV